MSELRFASRNATPSRPPHGSMVRRRFRSVNRSVTATEAGWLAQATAVPNSSPIPYVTVAAAITMPS